MKKRAVIYRIFECLRCQNKLIASKRADRMSKQGHIKTMYCPFCKDEEDFLFLRLK